ncbi:MAG TPA: Veg family protein [Bacillota bacterium]
MKEVGILDRIREDLNLFVGKPIRIKANRGRKRIFEVEGILEQTYPKVFVVRFKERQVERRISYSYADLLTKAVELSDGDNRIGLSAESATG